MKTIRRTFLVLLPALLLITGIGQSQDLTYLALGDSYTIGERVDENQRWPVQLSRALQDSGIAIAEPRIIAKTGWTTLELEEAIARTDLNPPYDLVSLLIGVNDQYDGLDFTKYPARFRLLLKKALALAGGKKDHVFVISIPDYSVTPFGQKKNPDAIRKQLARYNATNKSIAEKLGVYYINITPGSREAARDSSLIAPDGLHPSGKMYTQWVEQIIPVIFLETKTW